MMTKKRRYLISAGVFAVCVCVALAVLAMLPPGPGVTKANFDRVEVGMTLAEVEEIFGRRFNMTIEDGNLGIRIGYGWDGPAGSKAFLMFSRESVSGKQWVPSIETLSDKLRRWLHLPPAE